ncbi:lysozyme family protein [Cohnella rhizosphaerae]|uniref:Uncharacterized protein n=1 Tax=Cohnella rhizosphaerae TaxID=1457232 RepID=A0A9X4KX43_9BACL|nr:hypothetical protein [Cohnella rhizosphaerae]MDG0812914.1 hypothetical protein [Cohnella rhizosphaerae]
MAAMTEDALLTPGDVSVIRRYVRTKYAPMPASRQAEIVADAVVRTIRKRLPDWPEALKDEAAGRLVASCVVGERREVYPQDVLRVCADLALAEEAHAASLLSWLNERTAAEWTLERIAERTENGYVLKSGLAEATPSGKLPFGSATTTQQALVAGGSGAANDGFVSGGALRFALDEGQACHAAAGSPGAYRRSPAAMRPLVLAAVLLFAMTATLHASFSQQGSEPNPTAREAVLDRSAARPVAELADASARFAYSAFDAAAVKNYLSGRDSLLAERPYFEAIVESARERGVDPLLLFAVAGQEQGFVPKSAKKSDADREQSV